MSADKAAPSKGSVTENLRPRGMGRWGLNFSTGSSEGVSRKNPSYGDDRIRWTLTDSQYLVCGKAAKRNRRTGWWQVRQLEMLSFRSLWINVIALSSNFKTLTVL